MLFLASVGPLPWSQQRVSFISFSADNICCETATSRCKATQRILSAEKVITETLWDHILDRRYCRLYETIRYDVTRYDIIRCDTTRCKNRSYIISILFTRTLESITSIVRQWQLDHIVYLTSLSLIWIHHKLLVFVVSSVSLNIWQEVQQWVILTKMDYKTSSSQYLINLVYFIETMVSYHIQQLYVIRLAFMLCAREPCAFSLSRSHNAYRSYSKWRLVEKCFRYNFCKFWAIWGFSSQEKWIMRNY